MATKQSYLRAGYQSRILTLVGGLETQYEESNSILAERFLEDLMEVEEDAKRDLGRGHYLSRRLGSLVNIHLPKVRKLRLRVAEQGGQL
jgi:hypothetical protein